jgi:hypothetical protein
MLSAETPGKERITAYIDRDLSTNIRAKIAVTRQSISDFAVEAFTYYLKNYTRIKAQAEKAATKKDPEF